MDAKCARAEARDFAVSRCFGAETVRDRPQSDGVRDVRRSRLPFAAVPVLFERSG